MQSKEEIEDGQTAASQLELPTSPTDVMKAENVGIHSEPTSSNHRCMIRYHRDQIITECFLAGN